MSDARAVLLDCLQSGAQHGRNGWESTARQYVADSRDVARAARILDALERWARLLPPDEHKSTNGTYSAAPAWRGVYSECWIRADSMPTAQLAIAALTDYHDRLERSKLGSMARVIQSIIDVARELRALYDDTATTPAFMTAARARQVERHRRAVERSIPVDLPTYVRVTASKPRAGTFDGDTPVIRWTAMYGAYAPTKSKRQHRIERAKHRRAW